MTRPLRVLHVTDNYHPARGGLESAVSTLAAALAVRNHEVWVATLSRSDAPPYECIDGVGVHRLTGWIERARRFAADAGHQYHPTFRDPGLVRSLQELVDRFQPHVVHVHGWILYSTLPLRLPARTALVVSLHDFSLVCAKKTLLRGGRVCEGPSLRSCVPCASATYGASKGVPTALGLLGKRNAHQGVHQYIANSSYVAATTAATSGISRERIAVVPSPVPDSVLATGGVRPAFLPEGEFILFVGAMGTHKGLDVLLDAHQRLSRGLPMVILGLPRADSPNCDRPGVLLVENAPHEVVMASWRAATVGVVPSVCAEAFGLVAVEGMAAGTPMVVSAVGGLQEVVEPEVTGLVVPPGSRDALRSAIDRLISDPALRIAMGKEGRVRAQRYTVSEVVPQFEDRYREALLRRVARPGGEVGSVVAP